MSYNAVKDLEYIDRQISFYLYCIGLNGIDIDSYTIDEIITAARLITIAPIDDVESGKLNLSQDLSYLYLKNQRISLIGNIRRLWHMRQIAIGAIKYDV
jgi:hypothetical protein